MKTALVIAAVVLIGGAGGGWWYWRHRVPTAPVWDTEKIERGDLTAVISATGSVEPEEVVDVGAQVEGQVLSFGTDADGKVIDYGSRVEKGTVLAKIDDALYAADVETAKASLAQANAAVQQTRANLEQMKAKLFQAQNDWGRAQKVGPSDALSETDYDAYQANFMVAQANVAVAEAAIVQAQTGVAMAAAALKKTQQTLDYCTITSPVKGVIISRRVNTGQTVVASLNTPSLFLIAKDLTKMQVWVSVNEADIGSIHEGQAVIFTVDAYPGATFQGQVGKVRLNATMTQNVVTYTVEVNTDNSDGKLKPYMTANAQFIVEQKKGVLMASNAALRWTPSPEWRAPGSNSATTQESTGGDDGARHHHGASSRPGRGHGSPGTLWVVEGDLVRPIKVHLGITDGSDTEVRGDGVTEGMEVVDGDAHGDGGADGAGGTNPFLPQMPNRKR